MTSIIETGTIYIGKHTAVEDLSAYANKVFAFLKNLESSYPGFSQWWSSKVIPGLWNGTRTLILEMREGQIAGVAVLKDTDAEKKICTVKVAKNYQSAGLGFHLFEKSMRELDCDQPLLSVSADRLPEFTRIFQKFGYEFIQEYDGIYLPQKKELSFNGELLTLDQSVDNTPII